MASKPTPANGKLGIFTPGMGAVATTLYAGVLAARRGLTSPIGSLTQLGRLPMDGKNGERPLIKDVLPIARLEDIVFGAWDPYGADAYEAALQAKVVAPEHLAPIEKELRAIKPMAAVLDRSWVKKIEGDGNVKQVKNKWEAAQALMKDIETFKKTHKLERLVMVWTASTEAYRAMTAVHQNVAAFEQGLKDNDASISPSQIYCYAALRSRVPFANGTPSMTLDVPAMHELAMEHQVPVCGKDFKTGQTLLKTILAPGFKARGWGVRGWFSTNILGNRDGLALDDPESFRSKEVSKTEVLESILDKEQYPELYGDLFHKVRIEYYPPRGDDKEAWDNIDIFGWMGYPMQIKVDFLCKDSILAAPLALDLALLLDLASRAEARGTQEWMNFFFKAPMTDDGRKPVNDLFQQERILNEQLRKWTSK